MAGRFDGTSHGQLSDVELAAFWGWTNLPAQPRTVRHVVLQPPPAATVQIKPQRGVVLDAGVGYHAVPPPPSLGETGGTPPPAATYLRPATAANFVQEPWIRGGAEPQMMYGDNLWRGTRFMPE